MPDESAPHFGDVPQGGYILSQAGTRAVPREGNFSLDKSPFLPESLLSLESPTLHQQIQIIRRMAIRIARILHLGHSDMGGPMWYESWKEDCDFDDALEIAAVMLGALGTEIVSTDSEGVIHVRMDAWDAQLQDFILEHFVPYWHYVATANEDLLDDFEYDFGDRIEHGDLLRGEFGFSFFDDEYRLIDLDLLLGGAEENPQAEIVAVRKEGVSRLQPRRDFDQPLDRIIRVLIGVKHFFENSGEGVEIEPFSLEELEQRRREYIEEFPDEADVAEENYQDDIQGLLNEYAFWEEAAIIGSLGVKVVGEDDDGSIIVTMNPPQDLIRYLMDTDVIGDDPSMDVCYSSDIVDPVCLGVFEHVYFGADDEQD